MTTVYLPTRFTAAALAAAVLVSSAAASADDSVTVWMSQHQTDLTATLAAKLEDTVSAKVRASVPQPSVTPAVIPVTAVPAQRLNPGSEA